MIPMAHLTAWSVVAPWPELRQVEQDLIISRALVDIFGDPFLGGQLRFRGGTALNKIHFPRPLRYSEDIDLVQSVAGPIGPVFDRLRVVLEPWLGHAATDIAQHSPKMKFRVPAEDKSTGEFIRLKLEINTREHTSFAPVVAHPFTVDSPWFSRSADIATFNLEEALATKFRALLQRDKGRDLFDLAHALATFPDMDKAAVVSGFLYYLEVEGKPISRAEAEKRLFKKLAQGRVLDDMRPLVPVGERAGVNDVAAKAAIAQILAELVTRMPGDSWERTPEMMERFAIPPAGQSAQAEP